MHKNPNARWNCQVSFTVRPHPEYTKHDAKEGEDLGCGLIVGQRDSVWVHCKGQTDAEAIANAARKMAIGFGVLIENPTVYAGGFWH